jgi:23S rRNA (cytosine1962-C5)-methyltransferase
VGSLHLIEFKRYQLSKDSARIVHSRHPWIFRKHLSSAAEVFADGDFLELFDSNNHVVGHGIFDAEGLIAIRIFNFSKTRPNAEMFRNKIATALAKRENLRKFTTGFRAIHGENDGLPGIVVDVYGNTGVLQTYSRGVDALGRYLGILVSQELKLKNFIWKIPTKRRSKARTNTMRFLRGDVSGPMVFREGKLDLTVDIREGQKSGLFLDLRGLRKWLTSQNLKGKRVLNLFSYSGTLGLAAEVGGASEIWNVDISIGALDTAKRNHCKDPKQHRFIEADIFEWFKKLPDHEKFDLVIVDPPMMAAEMSQVPQALRAYRQLYSTALKHLRPKGQIVGCCCTSRIERSQFKKTVGDAFGGKMKLLKELSSEDDHPVAFPEGDYLKVLIYQV